MSNYHLVSRTLAAGVMAAISLFSIGKVPGETLDQVVLGNDAGTIRVLSPDLSTVLHQDGGFGVVTGIEIASNNDVVVANDTGTLYLRNPDLSAINAGNIGSSITAMVLQSDNEVFVAGNFGNPDRIGLRKADLTDWTANSPQGGFGTVARHGLGVQSDDDIILGANDGRIILRFAGDIDNGHSDGGYGVLTAIGVQSNDHIIAGNSAGRIWYRDTIPDNDSGGSNPGYGTISDIEIMADDTVLVGNAEGTLYVLQSTNVTTITSIGGLGTISALALQSDGDILVGNMEGQLQLLQYDAGTPALNLVTTQSGFGAITDLEVLRATVAIPGDYNVDGAVDAADYVLWRKNPDDHGGDPLGYITWRANFGTGTGAGSVITSGGAAVPEPASFVLAVVLASGMLSLGQRRCRS